MATEKRLIDADAIKYRTSGCGGWGIPENVVSDYEIAKMPTIDAVEVVRCKDCKYWKPGDSFSGDSLDDMQRIGGCPIVRFGRREKDFCCEGERKDNETD